MTKQKRPMGLLLLALSCLAVTGSASAAPQEKLTECVRAWFETRYGNAGYDHIIRLSSTCRAPVSCEVSSDVAPKPLRVEMLTGETQEVTLFRGSPAREFTPHAECQFSSAVAKGNDRR